MTQLYIEGQLCELSPDFKITLVTENVFFSKASTYTYDVKLPCPANSANAKIFEAKTRSDKRVSAKPMNAQLIVDNIVVLDGTAVVVGTSTDSISIQLLQGNSELNWRSKYENIYINELDMGTLADWGFALSTGYNPNFVYISMNLASQSGNKTFWKADCITNYTNGNVMLSPVINSETEELMNPLTLFEDNLILFDYRGGGTASNVYLPARLAPQPKLSYMVDKVFEAVGLTIGKNELADLDIYKNAVIANSTEVWYIANILPRWTLPEFVEQLQLMFNCVVVINNSKVDLLIREKYLNPNTPNRTEPIADVLDEFERDIDGEAETADADKPRKYDISYADFGRWFLGDDFASVPIYPASKLTGTPNPYVFAYTDKGNKVASPFLYNGAINGYVVDYFRQLDTPGDVATLRMVPTVPYENANLTNALTGTWSVDYRDLTDLIEALAATAIGTETLIEGRENIQDLIDAGETPSKTSYIEKMPISYLGTVRVHDTYSELWNFTLQIITPIFIAIATKEFDDLHFTGIRPSSQTDYDIFVQFALQKFDMSLFDLQEADAVNYFAQFYKEKTEISLAELYNFTFVPGRLLNAEKLFLIKNQLFVCKQIKYTITADGFAKIADGEFYKL